MWFAIRLVCLSLFFICSVSTFALAENEELSEVDIQVLEAAIDDYRFSDFKAAIDKLLPLHQAYPANKAITETLGRSYEESAQTENALALYQEWLATIGNDHADETRFAWMGMANSLIKLQKQNSAISSLKQWVTYHPDDSVASTMYGSLLFQSHDYRASAQVWDGVLNQPQASASDKSAAHYFKALLAYMEGDMDAQQFHASECLKAEAEGAYAVSAKQLMTARPARKLGLNASLALEEYFTSNVELLPDFKAPSPGKKKSDTSTTTTLSLTYNFQRDLTLGYIFSGDFHAKRNDLDLAYHSLFGLWVNGEWFISPKYEYAQLGRVYLFQGGGADVGWTSEELRLSYGWRYKVFNKNYLATDLRMLGGYSNRLDVSNTWKIEGTGVETAARLNISDESTKGNATYAKSDSYRQVGAGAGVRWNYDRYQLGGDADYYFRKYREPLPGAFGPARDDSHPQISGNITWAPDLPLPTTFTLKAGWQKNKSNDTTKSYSEWRTGLSVNLMW